MLLRTIWLKMLVTSILSRFPEIFLCHFFKQISSLEQCLTLSQNKLLLIRVCSTSLLKPLWEKEKLLVTSNFSFSHTVFRPVRELSPRFIKFKNCRLQTLSVWKSLKFVVWERVNMSFIHAFLLDDPNTVSSGEEVTLYQTTKL